MNVIVAHGAYDSEHIISNLTASPGSCFLRRDHDFGDVALRYCLPRVSDEFAFSRSKSQAQIHDASSLRTCVRSRFSPFVRSSLETADRLCLRRGIPS